MGEIGADLDQLSAEGDAEAEGTRRAKPKAAKPKEAAPAKPVEAPAKPEEGSEATPAKPEDAAIDEHEPTGLVEIRTAFRDLKKKIQQDYTPRLSKLADLEAKVKEYESNGSVDVKALQEKVTSLDARNKELEQHVKFVDYQQSDEFKKNFQQPYIEAWESAMADLRELKVEDSEGNFRDATQGDLVKLANLPLGEARKLANAMFGDSADDVMAHRRRIIDLSDKQTKALEDAKKSATEQAALRTSQQAEAQRKSLQLWKDANNEIVTKWPAMFGPVEGDEEGNTMLQKGEAMADRLFSPTEENRPKSIEEAVRVHALMRQKIRNHDRLALWLKKARARIKELEGSLAEYEKSNPNGGISGGGEARGGTGSYIEDANAEIEELNRKGA